MEWQHQIAVALFLFFGFALMTIVAIKMARMSFATANYRRAFGRVVRLVEAPASDEVTYFPVVEFHVEGLPLEIQGQESSRGVYRVGEKVSVYYPPGSPAEGVLITGKEWVIAWVGCAGGIFFILAGLFIRFAIQNWSK